jgi:hypothetical protein
MNESNPSESELDAPPKLVAALRECSRRKIVVASYVDRAILNASRRQLNKTTAARPTRFRRWMLWPGLAVACIFVAFIARLLTMQGHAQFVREDLNHDGRVDILDSFALARELKNSRPFSSTLDINGDGVVDERDVALIAAHAVALLAQSSADAGTHFRAVDIYVDAGDTPLAAYQLEFSVTNVLTKIVGVEGGGHPAFREPPFYDPKAIQQERVIIAAFSTEDAGKLPVGKTYVATIHIETIGPEKPTFQLKLQATANAAGQRIPATAICAEKKTQ